MEFFLAGAPLSRREGAGDPGAGGAPLHVAVEQTVVFLSARIVRFAYGECISQSAWRVYHVPAPPASWPYHVPAPPASWAYHGVVFGGGQWSAADAAPLGSAALTGGPTDQQRWRASAS